MIIAFAGHAQSGKTTAVNYIHGKKLKQLRIVEDFRINNDGKLEIFAIFNDEEEAKWGVFDLDQTNPLFNEFAQNTFWSALKEYNFASPLKDICINLFGLTYEQVYGTDEQKNTLTNMRWEDMPGIITNRLIWADMTTISDQADRYCVYHDPGQMTAREFMQYLGTNVFRKIKNNIWSEYCIKHINLDKPESALIGDCRFEDEINAVHEAGGKVILLLRNSEKSSHSSETISHHADKCDFVIDNRTTSLEDYLNKLDSIYRTI